MITVRHKQTKKLGCAFFNRTCAYISLKSQNLINDYDIVEVKQYLVKKGKMIGPFYDKESLTDYMMRNDTKGFRLLSTTKTI